jgi:hypothetical protein
VVEAWHSWGRVVVIALAALPVAAVAVVLLARARGGTGEAWRRSLAEVGTVAGTAPWIWMILTPRPGHRAVNPLPLRELLTERDLSTALAQIGGNLLVFAAFGFFAPMRWRLRLPRVIVLAAAGSVVVETLQYVLDLGRVSSVDDVLVNAIGAGLAALLSPGRRAEASGPGRVTRVAIRRYGERS